MARYRVNDQVHFHNPREMFAARTGTITEIIEDADLGAPESRYRISVRLRDNRDVFYTASDRHMALVNRPGEIAQEIQDPQPIAAPRAANEAEVEQTEAPVNRAQPMGIRWADIGFGDNMWGRTRDEEIKDQAKENIAQYRLNGIDPVDFLALTRGGEAVAVPIFESTQFIGALRANDYGNIPLDKPQFYRYTVNNQHLLPFYDVRDGVINFMNQETGDIWVNQYQRIEIAELATSQLDAIGVRWIRRGALRGTAVAPLTLKKSKKKLRRKYKEMPKIRDEQHYASKEYIA